MTRKDVHRESELDPSNYKLIEVYRNPPYMPHAEASAHDWRQYEQECKRVEEIKKMKLERGVKIHHTINRCDHCGATFKFGAVIVHTPDSAILTVGLDCLDNRFDGASKAKFQAERIKKVIAARKKAAETIEINKNKWKVIKEWCKENRSLLRVLNQHKYQNEFIGSLRSQLINTARLSARQMDALQNFQARMVAYQHKKAEENRKNEPVREGRQEILGTIISFKNTYNAYGIQTKVLIKSEKGFKIYGNADSFITANASEDSKVKFVATLKQSDRDDYFGFFKIPKKVEVIRTETV